MFATRRIALWAALFAGTMAICACNDGDKTISEDDGFENNGGDKGNSGNSGVTRATRITRESRETQGTLGTLETLETLGIRVAGRRRGAILAKASI